MTSSGRSPFDSPWPLSYRLPIVTFPLAPLVFEIFDLKVADTHTYIHTDTQNSTLSDNKGRLKLSAREPITLNCTTVGYASLANVWHCHYCCRLELLLTKLVIVLIAVVAREKSRLSSVMCSWLQVQSYNINV